MTVTDNSGQGSNNSNSEVVTVTIGGNGDAPDIQLLAGDLATALLTETNAGLTATDTLTVRDVDLSDTVSSSVTTVLASGSTAGLAPTNAQLLAMMTVAPASGLAANPGNSNNLIWTFNSGSEAFNYLDVGQTLTLTYTVRSTDSNGLSDTQIITVNVNGTVKRTVTMADGVNFTLATGRMTTLMAPDGVNFTLATGENTAANNTGNLKGGDTVGALHGIRRSGSDPNYVYSRDRFKPTFHYQCGQWSAYARRQYEHRFV